MKTSFENKTQPANRKSNVMNMTKEADWEFHWHDDPGWRRWSSRRS